MKKVIFGGLLFVGGAIMYSIGMLGIADVNVVVKFMKAPQYIGVAAMFTGLILGYMGMKKD